MVNASLANPPTVLRFGLAGAVTLLLALCCSSPDFQGLESDPPDASVKVDVDAGSDPDAGEGGAGADSGLDSGPEQPSCDNTTLDGNETDVDCGGTDCPPCSDGGYCEFDTDCEGGSCSNGVCRAPSCANETLDEDESDVDCGGSCPACEVGKSCDTHDDCETETCIEGLCELPTCSDDVLNQDESDVDCGGISGCKPCAPGAACRTAQACESKLCASGVCTAASCDDDVLNQDESDVDCGGVCDPCEAGKACFQPVDCESGVCTDDECVAAACDDEIKNGDETDVDCGGGSASGCDVCDIGAVCVEGSDCANGVCTENTCQDAECADDTLNGDETDVDCGGSCVSCPAGADCQVGSDCQSGVCTDDACQPPACDDDVLNQDETDTDCGGSCSGCPTNGTCSAGSDCASKVCANASCAAPSCSDSTQNGQESDVDCGGSCDPCSAGEDCTVDDDCDTGLCGGSKTCAYATSCADLLAKADGPGDGLYPVNPSGVSAFSVYCDMTTSGGGWTRVAHEPSGGGGYQVQGALALLAAEVGDADAVANTSGAGNIGPRFNGLYNQLRITWGGSNVQMTVPENIFANTVRTSIALTGVTTNHSQLQSAINNGGGAVFCRAHTSVAHPGDTSWAVKPSSSTDNTCGCSGMGWSGEGLFYGGAVPNDTCELWGGGWAGFRANGDQKAALGSTSAVSLWVR